VQQLSVEHGISQARKDDIVISITENESCVTLETAALDIPFVRTAMYEVIVDLHQAVASLRDSSNPAKMKEAAAGSNACNAHRAASNNVLSLITSDCIKRNLQGNTKEEVLRELVEFLAWKKNLAHPKLVLGDVLAREATMSTGMKNGIALPHAKTDLVDEMHVAIGIKAAGIDFNSLDKKPAHLFVLIISPKKKSGPHLQFLSAIAAVLNDETICQKVIASSSAAEVVKILRGGDSG
jgi:fructose-specific phosphotransferase system IIA component